MYNKKVMDLFENPCNVGSMNTEDQDVGTGMAGSPACGDILKLQIKVNNKNVIEDVKFRSYGCGAQIASSAYITQLLKGKTLDEALSISNKSIVTELELPPVKIHCSVLAEDAIKAAIEDYKNKNK